MLPHSQGNAEHAQDRFQTAARNLHENYAYEKLRDRRLMEYAISPLANTPPAEHLTQPGIGFGYMRVSTPAQLHANGVELESYLRGAGTKALEGRGANGVEAYAAVRVSSPLIPSGDGDGDQRAKKFKIFEDVLADARGPSSSDPLLARTWIRKSDAAASTEKRILPLPIAGEDTFRPIAPVPTRETCIIA